MTNEYKSIWDRDGRWDESGWLHPDNSFTPDSGGSPVWDYDWFFGYENDPTNPGVDPLPPVGGGGGGGSTADIIIHLGLGTPTILSDHSIESQIFASLTLRPAMLALDARIDSLSVLSQVRMPDGTYVSGLELQSMWNTAVVQLTTGRVYTNGGMGEVLFENGRLVMRVDRASLAQQSHTSMGLEMYFLHELMHLTASGQNAYSIFRGVYASNNPSDTGLTGWTNSAEWVAYERHTDWMARNMGDAIGVDLSGFTRPGWTW